MKLFIDCDETLVFWENPKWPYHGNYEVNTALVDVLKTGIDTNDYDVTIWSAGGADWAAEVSRDLFKGYNLPSYGKHEMYRKVPSDAVAVDDRLVHDRFYLYRFKKVFLPEEFVQYAKANQKLDKWKERNE